MRNVVPCDAQLLRHVPLCRENLGSGVAEVLICVAVPFVLSCHHPDFSLKASLLVSGDIKR